MNNPPQLKGLVLAGGRSVRMGHDKGLIEWHGKPQREYLAELLEASGVPAFISCRKDQAPDLQGYDLVVDQMENAGPLAAVYSAFLLEPETAWLVVACDMPGLDAATLDYLIEHRDPEAPATAFRAPAFEDDSPDPLLAIWEPASFRVVQERLSQDKRCARKALIQSGVHLLAPPDPKALSNVNTPEQFEAIREQSVDA